jgi:hypothetical protein
MAAIFGLFAKCVATAGAVVGGMHFYSMSPETSNNWKHKLKHQFGSNGVTVQHYDNLNGQRVIGARCVVCGQITKGDEHPDHREPADEMRSRYLHKVWAGRWGNKDHDLYLSMYNTPGFRNEVNDQLNRDLNFHPIPVPAPGPAVNSDMNRAF